MISARNADSLGNTGTILVTDDTINDLAVQIFALLLIFFFFKANKKLWKTSTKNLWQNLLIEKLRIEDDKYSKIFTPPLAILKLCLYVYISLLSVDLKKV